MPDSARKSGGVDWGRLIAGAILCTLVVLTGFGLEVSNTDVIDRLLFGLGMATGILALTGARELASEIAVLWERRSQTD